MARNISVAENNARFVDYPYDLRRDWWNDLQKAKLRAIASRIRPEEAVLDVGCNSGYFAEFCPPSARVHGVDLSPTLVEQARARLVSAQVAPAESLPFGDNEMHVVTMAGVIEYVFDPTAVLIELLRVARRCVVFTADHEDGVWGAHRVAHHEYMVRGYTRQTLHDLVSSAGVLSWESVICTPDGQGQHYVVEVVHRG